jgi:hypothetical protein
MASFLGSYFPFARTEEERKAQQDTRQAVAERYASKDIYLEQIRRSADDLVARRLVLARDVPAIVERARREWALWGEPR